MLDVLKPMFWGLWTVAHDGIYFLDSGPDGPPPCILKFFEFETRMVHDKAVLDGISAVHYQGLTASAREQALLYPRLEQTIGEIMIAPLE